MGPVRTGAVTSGARDWVGNHVGGGERAPRLRPEVNFLSERRKRNSQHQRKKLHCTTPRILPATGDRLVPQANPIMSDKAGQLAGMSSRDFNTWVIACD
jgi:hypothetical protein